MTQPKKILFIDPASISTGWAITVNGIVKLHGTIAMPSHLGIDKRLTEISGLYWDLGAKLSDYGVIECHIERLSRMTHYHTHWSIGAIMAGLRCWGIMCASDISPKAWQKTVDWNDKRKPLQKFIKKVESEDELAAIGMALHWKELYGKKD